MTTLSFARVRDRTLTTFDLELGPGLHVVLGDPADGTLELLELAAGLRSPRHGQVRLMGGDPYRSPALRRGIGAVLAEEVLVPASSVHQAVQAALAARGARRSQARDLLELFGLGALAQLAPEALSAADRRALAFALAASLDRPALLALHEPLALLPNIDREVVTGRIQAALTADAVVLCTTASPQDAVTLGGQLFVLERGRITRAPTPAATELVPGLLRQFLVGTPDGRRLASALSAEPEISAVVWDEQRAPGQLRVDGWDPSAVALAIVRAARRHQLLISSMVLLEPGLEPVRAATAGLARAAYDRAQHAAWAHAASAAQAAQYAAAPSGGWSRLPARSPEGLLAPSAPPTSAAAPAPAPAPLAPPGAAPAAAAPPDDAPAAMAPQAAAPPAPASESAPPAAAAPGPTEPPREGS